MNRYIVIARRGIATIILYTPIIEKIVTEFKGGDANCLIKEAKSEEQVIADLYLNYDLEVDVGFNLSHNKALLLAKALKWTGFNSTETAILLGVSRTQVYREMNELNIKMKG